MTNYAMLLEMVQGTPEDTSLRARLKDAKVVTPHDMPGVKRRLFDKGAVATGGVIKNGTLFIL
jgi:hypothetical protein